MSNTRKLVQIKINDQAKLSFFFNETIDRLLKYVPNSVENERNIGIILNRMGFLKDSTDLSLRQAKLEYGLINKMEFLSHYSIHEPFIRTLKNVNTKKILNELEIGEFIDDYVEKKKYLLLLFGRDTLSIISEYTTPVRGDPRNLVVYNFKNVITDLKFPHICRCCNKRFSCQHCANLLEYKKCLYYTNIGECSKKCYKDFNMRGIVPINMPPPERFINTSISAKRTRNKCYRNGKDSPYRVCGYTWNTLSLPILDDPRIFNKRYKSHLSNFNEESNRFFINNYKNFEDWLDLEIIKNFI